MSVPFSYDPERAAELIRSYPGLTRKRSIGNVTSGLGSTTNAYLDTRVDILFGDDAAVLEIGPAGKRDGYCSLWVSLMAADGIMGHLVETDPYWAGYASILVNVNDIAAMGGLPVALVDIIASGEDGPMEEMVRGLKDGCEKFGVPVVGGHTHPDGPPSLSVAIYGIARSGCVIDSFHARPGMRVVMAMDTDGRITPLVPYSWDTTSHKSPELVRAQIGLLYELAGRGLVAAAKDLSNPGSVGTLAMLCETSSVGAVVDLDLIPRPEIGKVDPYQWLTVYQGCGFVLAVDKKDVGQVIDEFGKVGMAAADIGSFVSERTVKLIGTGIETTLVDLSKEGISGKHIT